MASTVAYYREYRIAIYSPGGHFAVITPPRSNAVINFGSKRPKSSVVEGPEICIQRAKIMIDDMIAE